jgi:probable rRNA maturation factor
MIVNRQRRVRVPVRALDEFLRQACKALRVPRDAVTICLVTNSEMTRWNRLYRGKNRPTDVLSFIAEPMDGRGRGRKRPRIPVKGYLGDIAIAPAVARRNAKQFGRTFGDEMCILILHGILHLMGYDHETDAGQMERRERGLRRALGLG